MNLQQAMQQVHKQWHRREPITLSGTVRQVTNFLRLCMTVEYPQLDEQTLQEIQDEHSN